MEHSANILLLGKTGVGKSSFINYFLGKEVAETGGGRPVTPHLIPYEIKDGHYPIKIYDSKGLEIFNADKQLDEIIEGVKTENNSDDIFNWFHTIFYCISMANRLEDFEIEFIHRLQNDLTQHIHIILTQCDSCEPEIIHKMREKIEEKLGKEGVEIFEVVCISKKKRDGTTVQPSGKEVILSRVFDLFLEDIADKLSRDYARSLREAFVKIADQTRDKVNNQIDSAINPTLFEAANIRLDEIVEQALEKINKYLEEAQKRTDQEFNQILQPAAQLYSSYKGIVTNSFAESASLTFNDWDIYEWIGESFDLFDEKAIKEKILQNLHEEGFVDNDGNFVNNKVSIMLLSFFTGKNRIGKLKKGIKELCQQVHDNFLKCLPEEDILKQEAYNRIIEYIKKGENAKGRKRKWQKTEKDTHQSGAIYSDRDRSHQDLQ